MKKLWCSRFGHVLRWVIFIPVGFFLHVLILWMWYGIASDMRHLARVSITKLLGEILSPEGSMLYVIPFALAGALCIPVLACRHIAPNPKVASIIYGTMTGLAVLRSVIASASTGDWALVFFVNLAINVLVLLGCVFVALEAEEKSKEVIALRCE